MLMTRPLRVEMAGGGYHVTARGNERRAIYRDDTDRGRFLETVREGLAESPLEKLEGRVVLGGREFVERVRGMLKGNVKEQPGCGSCGGGAGSRRWWGLSSGRRGRSGWGFGTVMEIGGGTWCCIWGGSCAG